MAKAFYIGVGGVARKVKQPYIGVNSVARKVKKGYIGVNGVARQFFSGGTPISSLAVGSTLYLNENGSSIPYLVVHQGKPSSIYDDSCNGTYNYKSLLGYERLAYSRAIFKFKEQCDKSRKKLFLFAFSLNFVTSYEIYFISTNL